MKIEDEYIKQAEDILGISCGAYNESLNSYCAMYEKKYVVPIIANLLREKEEYKERWQGISEGKNFIIKQLQVENKKLREKLNGMEI